MMRRLTAIAVLGLMMGCSDEDTPAERDDGVVTDAATSSKPDAGSKKDSSTAAPSSSKDAATGQPDDPTAEPSEDASTPLSNDPPPDVKFDYQDETVELKKDLVIAAGNTVRVGPGTTFHSNGDFKLQVDGTLEVYGSTDEQAAFTGGASQSSWHGIVVSDGGTLNLRNAHISGARYGIYAEKGSTFSVTDSVFDTSFKTAVVYSDGSFKNTVFKAAIPPTIAITEGVSVDDPNGTLTIIDSSPSVENCEFAGASPFTDLVRIGGQASPTFDHVYLHDAHCGFHINGAVNNSPRIRNAILSGFSYGFMAYTGKPIVEASIFKGNTQDFGLCSGATKDNAPQLEGNFYSAGDVSLDSSCFKIEIADASKVADEKALPNAGAKGL